MKKILYTFNFNLIKIFLKFIFFFLILNFISLFILNFLYLSSEFRFNKIFSFKEIDQNFIIIGNSRSIQFNKYNLRNENIFNLAFNEINLKSLDLILHSLSKTTNNFNKLIFIELTTINIDNKLDCDYGFYYYSNNFDKKNFKKECIKNNYFKIMPVYILNSKFFYRSLYYIFNEDQKWSSSKVMNDYLCASDNSTYDGLLLSKNIPFFLKELNSITNKYNNLNFKFWLAPVFKKYNSVNIFEDELVKTYSTEIVQLNKNLDKTFYNNCLNFSDHLHLSKKGVFDIADIFNELLNDKNY